ncbi:MAG: dihydrolipoamide acetyltransferase family protein [Gemmataceae bacterium]
MEFALPEIGEGVYEAELVRWLVAPGDAVKPGQPLLEVMTDKATMEVPAPFAGSIDAVLGEPGAKVKVGDVILRYTSSKGAAAPEPPPAHAAGSPRVPSTNGTPSPTPLAVRAAPSVRQLARKLGIDLASVHGSGPDGRILIDDLSARLKTQAPAAKREPALLDVGEAGTRTKLVGLRRKIAEHMVLSKRTIPHYSYVDECDVTALVGLRDSLKDTYQTAGVKLTYLAFVVKAVAGALKEIPLVNASLDEAAGEIVLHAGYHVGVAVATPAGLIVPVIRDADRKDVGAIAREVERLSGDARAGKTKLEDLRGGTFTVTSVGGIGGLITTPVINHPEVGILGVGKIVRRPVYDDRDQIRPASLLYLSFSFDHRVVDGAVGAVFGNAVIRRLRNPAALLLPDRL